MYSSEEQELRAEFIYYFHFSFLNPPIFYTSRSKTRSAFLHFRMPKKVFDCTKCGGSHQRPINSKRKLEIQDNDGNEASGDTMDTNSLIFQELKSLNGRMAEMERKVDGAVHSPSSSLASSSKATPSAEDSEEEDDELILPSIKSLQQSKHMQAQVDQRIQQLKDLNKQGKFKSQGGGGGGGGKTLFGSKKRFPGPRTLY